MMTQVEVVLTFESGRRHMVRVKADDGLASAMDDAKLALELYLEDHPNGPDVWPVGTGDDDDG